MKHGIGYPAQASVFLFPALFQPKNSDEMFADKISVFCFIIIIIIIIKL